MLQEILPLTREGTRSPIFGYMTKHTPSKPSSHWGFHFPQGVFALPREVTVHSSSPSEAQLRPSPSPAHTPGMVSPLSVSSVGLCYHPSLSDVLRDIPEDSVADP